MTSDSIKGTLCVTVTAVSAGILPSLAFIAFDRGVTDRLLLYSEFAYAAVILWIIAVIKKEKILLNGKQYAQIGAVTFFFFMGAVFLFRAFEHMSGSLATVISFTFPAVVVVMEMAMGKRKPSAVRIAAAAVSVAGVAAVCGGGGNASLRGVVLASAASLCYAAYTMILDMDEIKNASSVVTTAYIFTGAAVLHFIRCVISGSEVLPQNMSQLGIILSIALICGFLNFYCYLIGIKYIGPGNAALIDAFEPVVACIAGSIILGDTFTAGAVIGCLMIFISVVLANLPEGKPGRRK